MEQTLVIPDIETIRTRRRQIADEDRRLEEIEKKLLEAAHQWAAVANPSVRLQFDSLITAGAARANTNALAVQSPAATPAASAGGRRFTKNAAIIEALSAPRDLWQTANQIREAASMLLGKDIPMSSISPALTDLKKSGTIARRDMTVALVLRLEKEEPSYLNENGEAGASPETDRAGTLSDETPASSGAQGKEEA